MVFDEIVWNIAPQSTGSWRVILLMKQEKVKQSFFLSGGGGGLEVGNHGSFFGIFTNIDVGNKWV